MPDNKQPSVLVKKADGSTVRMTLDEVKAMKKEEKAVKPHAPKKQKTKEPPASTSLSTAAPVAKIFVDEAKAEITPSKIEIRPPSAAAAPPPWKKDDTASPLEEKPAEPPRAPVVQKEEAIVEDTPLGPAKEVVEKILKKAGWDLSDAIKARLTPVILSRVKEVRTDGQFLVHAMTPTHRGGVGLSPAQAEQLLAAVQSFLPQQAQGGKNAAPPPATLPSSLPAKPVMRDITPPAPRSAQMGPKEEFAAFSLADFKRLGATTDASLSRLKEKFDTLKNESYILFLDVRDAWFESPLATSYVEKVLSALREKKKLADVLSPAGSREGMSLDVVKAIVEVNTYISA